MYVEDYKEKQAPDKNDKAMGSLRYTSAELKKVNIVGVLMTICCVF